MNMGSHRNLTHNLGELKCICQAKHGMKFLVKEEEFKKLRT